MNKYQSMLRESTIQKKKKIGANIETVILEDENDDKTKIKRTREAIEKQKSEEEIAKKQEIGSKSVEEGKGEE